MANESGRNGSNNRGTPYDPRGGRENRGYDHREYGGYYGQPNPYGNQPNRYNAQPGRNGAPVNRYGEQPGRNGGQPNRNGKKKKKGITFGDVFRFLLMLIALGVFLYSGWTLYGFYKEYKKSSNEYDNLESSFAVTPDDEDQTENYDALEDDDTLADAQALQSVTGREVANVVENDKEITVPVMVNPINFEELQQVNDDIVGWLRVRALDISYPVVKGEDNDFYLHRTFEKTDNFAGCLFMNYTNREDLTDQNTIIYGHNMKNGSMFGKLKNFNDEEVFKKSKYFWIYTPDLIYQYRIFSASVVSTTGLTYQTSFTEEEFDRFINSAFSNSVVDNTNVEVTRDDRVMTLSTCTGDESTRFVVMGKLAQVYASKKNEQ